MHRVSLPQGATSNTNGGLIGSRYSIPYFVAPDHEAVVACLPSCVTEEKPLQFEPVRWCDYGEYMSKHMYKNEAGKAGEDNASKSA